MKKSLIQFAMKFSLINSIIWHKHNPSNYSGKYIVIEGICGSGKDTQSRLLADKLNHNGYKAIKVHEAGDLYHSIIESIKKDSLRQVMLEDQEIRRHLHIADRYHFVKSKLLPSLRKYDFVVSARSFISTLVYQCDNKLETSLMNFIHEFVPTPNLVVFLDNDPSVSLERIKKRNKENNSIFHNEQNLKFHRGRYLDIYKLNLPFPHVIINSTPPKEIVHETILQEINNRFQLWSYHE